MIEELKKYLSKSGRTASHDFAQELHEVIRTEKTIEKNDIFRSGDIYIYGRRY